jgi:hypothetical protein
LIDPCDDICVVGGLRGLGSDPADDDAPDGRFCPDTEVDGGLDSILTPAAAAAAELLLFHNSRRVLPPPPPMPPTLPATDTGDGVSGGCNPPTWSLMALFDRFNSGFICCCGCCPTGCWWLPVGSRYPERVIQSMTWRSGHSQKEKKMLSHLAYYSYAKKSS